MILSSRSYYKSNTFIVIFSQVQAVLHVSEREIRQRVDGFAFERIDGSGALFGVLESGVTEE